MPIKGRLRAAFFCLLNRNVNKKRQLSRASIRPAHSVAFQRPLQSYYCAQSAAFYSCFSFGFQRTAGRLLSKGFSHSLSPVAGRLTTCAKVYRRPRIGGFCTPLISIPPLWPFMNTIREPYCATSIRRQRDEENPIIRAVPLTVGLKCALYCTVSSK